MNPTPDDRGWAPAVAHRLYLIYYGVALGMAACGAPREAILRTLAGHRDPLRGATPLAPALAAFDDATAGRDPRPEPDPSWTADEPTGETPAHGIE